MAKSRSSLTRRDVLQGIGLGFGLVGLSGAVPFRLKDKRELEVFSEQTAAPAPTDWRSAKNKIDSVVILCMENRSFDHYFGAMTLPVTMGGLGLAHRNAGGFINGLTGNESNPSGHIIGGSDIKVHRLEDFTPHDLPHDWDEMHQSFGNGNMDGFVAAAQAYAIERNLKLQKGVRPPLSALELAETMGKEAMGFHTPDQIPLMYQLAEQTAVCQNYYSSVMGPTWTNRFYLHGATSESLKDNLALGSVIPLLDLVNGWESILDVMEKQNGFESMNFYHDFCWLRSANPDMGREFRRQFQRVVHRKDAKRPTGFFARARENLLPALTILDPHFGIFRGEDANDDHPDAGGVDPLHDIRKGQALIATVIKAIAQNPKQWERTLLLVTYDEAGGFYDHEPPPNAKFDKDPEFLRLGFRVPTIAIGPYVRKGCMVDTVLDHSSILKSIEQLFGTERVGQNFHFENRFADPAVQRRLDLSNDLLSCLDADALEGRPHDPPLFDPVKISLSKWKNLPRVTNHKELYHAARELPEEFRKEAEDPILDEVMQIGCELGAVKMKA
jgi:phospholipase C